MLDWSNLGQERFDRVTASLIRRCHTGASDVRERVIVPDARGGDQGIDILVVDGDEQWLYQQKYFPEGFSGGFRDTRRRQIRESFDQAMRLEPRPDVWVLVVPRNLTPGEREFLEKLPQRVSGGSNLKIQWVGQAELDDLVARHPDVEGYALRDATSLALERAGGVFPPDTLLTSLEDYTRRMGDLNAAADNLDPDWTPRFVIDPTGEQALTVVPKHDNPRPIEHVLRVSIEDMTPDTRKQWEQVLGYGMPGEVRVRTRPGDSFYRQAPQFLMDSHDPNQAHEYQIKKEVADPHPLIGRRVELRLEMPNHTHVAELLTVTAVSEGLRGVRIELEASACCNLELRVPTKDPSGSTARQLSLTFHLDLTNSLPREALEALDLRAAFVACTKATLALPTVVVGRPVEAIVMNGPGGDAVDEETAHSYEDYRMFLEDLAIIQRHTRQKFMPPKDISEYERIVVRFLRLLLEGHVVSIPRLRSIDVTLHPDGLVANEDLLPGEGFALLAPQETFSIQLWGRELPVPGPVNTYHPAVHLEPVDDIGTKVRDDHTARITPINGGHFVAYRPDHVRGDNPAPTPWGLRGIPEQLTYDPGTSR